MFERQLLWIVVLLALVTATVSAFAFTRPDRPSTSLPGTDETTLSAATTTVLHRTRDRRHDAGIAARTHHLEEDGRPRYTNRLVNSTSPYLLQHAHNPVNWFPWGDEAFEVAKKLNLPVFLSVGYATCHWCHVMEEESFEDPEIAAYLNAHFIPIKVDRETRPDVDRIYMAAVNAINGRGGWPMSVWLKPDRKPFFAATYIPARDGDRGTRRGFLTYLKNIVQTWETTPDEIESTAERLTEHLRNNLKPAPGSGMPTDAVEQRLVAEATSSFDPEHGGRKGSPKFWSSFPIRVLLAQAARGDETASAMALKTLDQMASGGVYDQVGGGFHRYSVDDAWRVPHFEKMLYDNAQLARIYGEAFQLTRDFHYAAVVEETLGFIIRELGANGGGFAAALDADSLTPSGEREEGWFYTWTPAELGMLDATAPSFIEAYGVTESGELDGRNVLHFPVPPTLDHRRRFSDARLALQLERRKRPAPLRDDKVVTSWNGLAIGALAYNGWLLGRPDWIEEARIAADRVLANRVDGRLQRTDGENGPEGVAFLEDYAFLIEGLITLYEATGDTRWIREARELEGVAHTFYRAPEGSWYSTPSDHEELLVRSKPANDGAIPSANTVMLGVMVRLAALTGEDRYRAEADQIATGLPIARAPRAFPEAVLGLTGRFRPLHEVVLVLPEGQRSPDLTAAVRTIHPSTRVLMQVREGDPALEGLLPPAVGKVLLEGKPTAYVCHGGVCDRPTTDPAVLAELLAPPKRPGSPGAP